MDTRCPACGARLDNNVECRTRFDEILGLEFSKPAYFAVHHLSVAAYQLQHNHYSREGWITMARLLCRFIRDGIPVDVAAREIRNASARGDESRNWTKGPKLSGVEAINWRKTIADVRLETSELYCADVKAWAEAVCRDAGTVLESLPR